MNDGVDLYWLPLGAGGHCVRLNGRVYEACDAAIHRRSRRDLYHFAVEVHVPSGRFVIEQTPVPDGRGHERGVVAEGAVGSRWAARLRVFRYEIRRWRDGLIPDVDEAVDSPRRLTDDPGAGRGGSIAPRAGVCARMASGDRRRGKSRAGRLRLRPQHPTFLKAFW